MPFYSIIIPVFNVEDYLQECVDSVLFQTFYDMEIMLVNDGSTDSSPQICDEYAQQDVRVQVIHKANGGLSDARNAGISLATGDYILCLDSDDYWDNNQALEIMYDVICQHPDTQMLMFQAKKYKEQLQQVLPDAPWDCRRINHKDISEVLTYLLKSNTYSMSACTKVVRRSLLTDNDIHFEKGLLGEDLDWFIQTLIPMKHLLSVDLNCYVYRQRVNSITHSVSLKYLQDSIYIKDKWARKLTKLSLTSLETTAFYGVLAYSFIIDIFNYHQLSRENQHAIRRDIRRLDWLLQYPANRKIKWVGLCYRLVGLSLSSWLMNIYWRL